MAHPIIELARLTARSKQIDGTPFGGQAADNLEVAAAMGMRNPVTGKKLSREAEFVARYAFCLDSGARVRVKAALLRVIAQEAGKMREDTLIRLCNSALREFISPESVLNKAGQRVIIPKSKHRIAHELGISHSSFTDRHQELYNVAFAQLSTWADHVVSHLRASMDNAA